MDNVAQGRLQAPPPLHPVAACAIIPVADKAVAL